jgi:hypothetical protein
MLTAYFNTNSALPTNAEKHKYIEFPKHYVWIDKTHTWKPREKFLKPVIGRLAEVSPSRGDLFYLRQMLKHVIGKTSFVDMRTVNGVVHPTYKAAAIALGLLRDDEEYIR